MKPQARNVVLVACVSAAVLYLIVGLIGYAAFGRETQSDIIAQISAHSGEDGFIMIIQSVLASFIIFKTPLLVLPLRNLSIGIVSPTTNPIELVAWKHILLTFGLLTCVYIATIALPLLGTVLAVNGAVCVIPLTFVVPARVSWSIEVPRPAVRCLVLALTGIVSSIISLVVLASS